ncbi:MAG: DUF362 domain-containing protein [Victivallales bacterium]|nr:DUF362 domain-containing protein [Victivallales bacterium]
MPNKAIVGIGISADYDSTSVEAAVRNSLEPFGGMGAFVKPGQKVLLKVNLVAPSSPPLAVTTHPEVLRAVIRLVKEAGGIAFVGDGPGVGDTETAARVSGLTEVIDAEGASLLPFNDVAIYENLDNTIIKKLALTAHLKNMDVLITLPKLKTHCQMAFTGALKNQFGLIPGAAKGQFHFRFQNRASLADLMIDINRTAHTALAIMDGIVGMEGPGPSGGTPRQIGAIISGPDLAAVDTVACDIIGLSPEEVPVSIAARRANYGATRLQDIEVFGASLEQLRIPDFKLVKAPANIMQIVPLPKFMLRWLRAQMAPKPHIKPETCIKCRRCEKGCPVSPPAITPLAPPKKQVNDKTCIRCYGCHEFCPVKAIELKKSTLAKLIDLNKLATWASKLLGRLAAPFR